MLKSIAAAVACSFLLAAPAPVCDATGYPCSGSGGG